MATVTARPSLLVKYLASIGPGTVVCKAGPATHDTRFDGTSHELLQAALPQFHWLPIETNWQETVSDKKRGDLITALTSPDKAGATALAFYEQHMPQGYKMLQSCIHAKVRPQSILGNGPVVIVGNPISYSAFAQTHAGSLQELLTSAGFSPKYNMVSAHDEGARRGLEVQRCDGQEDFLAVCDTGDEIADDGLIYLARSNENRIVVVIAGTTVIGTLGGTLMATSAGMSQFDQQVFDFIENDRQSILVRFRSQASHDSSATRPLMRYLPIHNTILPGCTDASSEEIGTANKECPKRYDAVACRELEVRLDRLVPPPPTRCRNPNRLVEYLRDNGPASAIVKTYFNDQRDDETAKDLIESLLPETHYYPVPDAPMMRGTDLEFQRSLDDFLQWTQHTSTGRLVADCDREGIERMKSWQEQLNGSVNRWYSLPNSGPLIILGAPESFAGYAETPLTNHQHPMLPSEDEAREYKPRSQLRRLTDGVGYPNRFVLEARNQQRVLVDRVEHNEIPVGAISGSAKTNEDVGFVHLGIGVDSRLTITIVGNSWLGTLAGAELLFNRHLPVMDQAFDSLCKGERQNIDLAFSCQLISHTSRDGLSPTTLVLNYPAHELNIELINSPSNPDIHFNAIAERQFEKLWPTLEPPTKSRPATPPPLLQSDYFDWTFAPSTKILTINAKVTNVIDGVRFFYSKPTSDTISDIIQSALQARKEQDSRKADKLPPGWCFSFLVVGQTGTGKESIAALVHRIVHANQKLLAINCSTLVETLVESQVFGLRAGAFSGAIKDRVGNVEAANGGVLLLDEFTAGTAQMQERFQPMLLRLMQFGEVQAVGANAKETTRVDLVLVAATNASDSLNGYLDRVNRGEFRPDVYRRFHSVHDLLPLRDRPLEILPTFAWYYCCRLSRQDNPVMTISVNALRVLLSAEWRGNFRELEMVAQKLAVMTAGEPITCEHVFKVQKLKSKLQDSNEFIQVALAFSTRTMLDEICPPKKEMFTYQQVETVWPDVRVEKTVDSMDDLLEDLLKILRKPGGPAAGFMQFPGAHQNQVTLETLIDLARSIRCPRLHNQNQRYPDLDAQQIDNLVQNLGAALHAQADRRSKAEKYAEIHTWVLRRIAKKPRENSFNRESFSAEFVEFRAAHRQLQYGDAIVDCVNRSAECDANLNRTIIWLLTGSYLGGKSDQRST